MKNLLYFLIFISLFTACETDQAKVSYAVHPDNRSVMVENIIQANAYTYLEVKEGKESFWIAVPTMTAAKSDKLYFSQSMEMVDFYSRDLDKTFERVLFVDNISKSPIPAPMPAMGSQQQPHTGNPTTERKEVKLQPQEGVVSIKELFDNKAIYANKVIKVAGEVTKFNTGILGTNWAHIQDGTSSGDHFDLTVTTDDIVPLGDVVVFEGTIVLDKDLGSGYYFNILMEKAKATRAVMY